MKRTRASDILVGDTIVFDNDMFLVLHRDAHCADSNSFTFVGLSSTSMKQEYYVCLGSTMNIVIKR